MVEFSGGDRKSFVFFNHKTSTSSTPKEEVQKGALFLDGLIELRTGGKEWYSFCG